VTPGERAGRWAPLGLLLAAAILQATRVPFRWNQITFAYAAYYREYVRIVELEGPVAALTTFVGAHPPGYSMLFAAMMAAAVPGGMWLAVSGAWSVSVVATAGRALREHPTAAVAAAAVLAVSPYRNAYGLEVNNYPMLVGVAGLQWWAFARWRAGPSRGSGAALAAATAAVVWTHALGVTLPVAQAAAMLVADRGRLRVFLGWAAAAAAICLPLLVGVVASTESPPINDPPGAAGAARALVSLLPGRYGSAAATWMLAIAAAGGAFAGRGSPLGRAAACHVVVGLGAIGALVATGAAADHQLPYYLVVLPASAMLVGFAAERWGAARLVVAVALAGHLASLAGDVGAARAAMAGAPHTHELVRKAVDAWGPGDSLLLVQFPVHGDDDKDVLDAAYSFIDRGTRVYFDDPEVPTQVPADPYFGQPVRMGDRWLYTFATFDPERFDLIHDTVLARGERLVVVHYDTAQQPQDGERIAFWARGKGRRPDRDVNEALWVFLP